MLCQLHVPGLVFWRLLAGHAPPLPLEIRCSHMCCDVEWCEHRACWRTDHNPFLHRNTTCHPTSGGRRSSTSLVKVAGLEEVTGGGRGRGALEQEMSEGGGEDCLTHRDYLNGSWRCLSWETLATPTSQSPELFARQFCGRIPGLQVDWRERVPNGDGMGTLVSEKV